MRGLRFGKSLVTAQKAASYYSCLRNKYSALLQFIECPPAKPSLRSKSQLPRTAQPSHKAASANPLGFVRAGCFESPAPLSAGDGASKDQKVVGPHIRRPRPLPNLISHIHHHFHCTKPSGQYAPPSRLHSRYPTQTFYLLRFHYNFTPDTLHLRYV